MSRRAFDFYPTPEWATRVLLDHVDVSGAAYEPCVGAGDIARILAERVLVFTNDIDQSRVATIHFDARQSEAWQQFTQGFDWVVSNPPFSDAFTITKLAHQHARVGVAMLLRLSFAEPTEDRGPWLAAHPPTSLIVCPRISFTGDGKTDSVTTAWFVWDRRFCGQRIVVVPKTARGQLFDTEVA